MAGQKQLTELTPGEVAVIEQLPGNDGPVLRLMELGLLPGTPVRFVRRAPLGDPLEIEVRGCNLSLRSEEARGISVKLPA